MKYLSKYFSSTYQDPNWPTDQLWWTIEKLEMASHDQLLKICEDSTINLRFYPPNSWKKTTSSEQIILALITDYSPQQLIPVIQKII